TANAWHHHRRLNDPAVGWQQPSLEKEILSLRRALQHTKALPSPRPEQIHTNLANALDTCGRFVEALRDWNHPLQSNPDFRMARCTRAIPLSQSALQLESRHIAITLFQEADPGFTRALQDRLDQHAASVFRYQQQWVKKTLRMNRALLHRYDLTNGDLGKSTA